MELETIFGIIILVISIIIHEVAHGVMAYMLGDMTAKRAGRLTLNPIPHIDPMGSIILPGLMMVTHSPLLFGWAKPVPYNPYNFRRGGRWGEMLVALAGPFSNFMLAIIFGVSMQSGLVPYEALGLAYTAIFINVLLGMFNLIPIPPLDGSKVLPAVLPRSLRIGYEKLVRSMAHNPMLGFGLVIILMLAFGSLLSQFVETITRLVAGI